ncbi:MAG: putative Ig domain-containing protein, partial [Acidobacteriia bacterium]|nr:putative Ig domain-containing protein [Terriglobia bacterium]
MTTTFLSATQVSATIPSALLVAAGTAQISVYIPGRWGGTSSALTFTIGSAAAPAITTTTTPLSLATSLPNGTVSTAYTAPMASGGTAPYTLTLTSGALPAGLSFSPSNGQLAGTPTTAASHSFGAQVSDSASNTASYTYSMSIAASTSTTTTSTTPLTLATSLANGTVNTAYAAPVASGGATPYALTITSGGLPAGLSFDASTGALAGTP